MNPYETKAWKSITKSYGEDITYDQLKILAELCSVASGVRLSRKNKRTTTRIIKWFDANFAIVKPYIKRIIMVKEE